MTKQELQDHLKQNIWKEDKEGNIYGYGAAIVVSALYKKIYGDYPKIGLNGSQAMAVMDLLNDLPESEDLRSQKNERQRCPCGAIILADTEDWEVPICYDCYTEK